MRLPTKLEALRLRPGVRSPCLQSGEHFTNHVLVVDAGYSAAFVTVGGVAGAGAVGFILSFLNWPKQPTCPLIGKSCQI